MYREVSLFKQHPSLLEPRHADPDVRRACDYWYGAGDAGGELFRFYANGKSIIRVHEAMRECGSVHEWSVPSKQFAASATGTNNAALRHSQYVYHQLMRLEEMGGAVLLHYACCSFGTFLKKKRWADLGYASPNHRFRGGGGGLDQRANALALADRRDEAEAFYRRNINGVREAEKPRRQLQAGVCMRMPAAEIVAAARATAAAAQHGQWDGSGGGEQERSSCEPHAVARVDTSIPGKWRRRCHADWNRRGRRARLARRVQSCRRRCREEIDSRSGARPCNGRSGDCSASGSGHR